MFPGVVSTSSAVVGGFSWTLLCVERLLVAVVLAVVPAPVWPQAHAAFPGVVSTVVGDFSLYYLISLSLLVGGVRKRYSGFIDTHALALSRANGMNDFHSGMHASSHQILTSQDLRQFGEYSSSLLMQYLQGYP